MFEVRRLGVTVGSPLRRGGFWCAAGIAALTGLLPVKLGVVCGHSMEPSLASGGLYLLDRNYYRSHPVQPGDVVVASYRGKTYLKRVLAVSGDELPVIRQTGMDGDADIGDQLVLSSQLPRIRKAAHRPFFRNTIRLVRRRVPAETLYLVGDNLIGSVDSRSFGPVPTEAVLGRVLFAPPADPGVQAIAVHRSASARG